MDYLNYVRSNNTVDTPSLNDYTKVLYHSPVWWFPKPLPPKAYEWALWLKEKSYEDRVQKSNRGGFQSPGFTWEEFQFRDHIQSILSQFKEFKEFEFTNWWLNINEKGDYNLPHQHPGADLSLIWYITHNEGLLNFQDPDLMSRHKLYARGLYGEGEENSKFVICPAGSLLVFPSDLIHRVDEHMLDTPRISVSSNLLAKY